MKLDSCFKIIGICALTAVFLIAPFSNASHSATPAPFPRYPKATCRIEIDDAHISTSLLRNNGIRVVKVNAKSICNVRQERVSLTLEIYKVGRFSNYLTHRSRTNPNSSKSAGLVVKIQDLKVLCINSKASSYFGVAFAKAFIQGKWQYAGKTRSLNVVKLNCGN
jgi:hypothetical protein